MIVERPGLLTRYENLRQKTFAQLSNYVDTLGKVDGLPPPQLEQARDALFHADHPYLVVLLGPFNTGKSSLINALIGEDALTVGATPTTSQIAILRHGPTVQRLSAGETVTLFHPAPLLERVSLVDTPGLDSVFKGHDEITRRFLHRADLVLLVMLVTQAMSASNLAYLQGLRDYGKRVIVVINQIDLIEPDEQQTVRNFVADQAKTALGFAPEVWLVSSRQARAAQKAAPEGQPAERDAALWKASGFAQIETYINRALSDAARARQKLETPLQIARNVMAVANEQVRLQQDALAEYRRASQNVRSQIDAAMKEQAQSVTQTADAIGALFDESARRGREAIGEVFQWGRALGLLFGGLGEIVGIGRLFRRYGKQGLAKNAFEARQADEPLSGIPAEADRLGPRLEGRDVKDTDDLVLYARRELDRLPGALKEKVIGAINPPSSYDREIMRQAREPLAGLLDQARSGEAKTIDRAVRGTMSGLGVFVLSIILMAVILFGLFATAGADGSAWSLLTLVVIALLIGSFAALPLRGALMMRAHTQRIEALRRQYLERLKRAADDQLAFGRQMRQDAIAPFLRMVETQLAQADQIKAELAAHAQQLTTLEAELGSIR